MSLLVQVHGILCYLVHRDVCLTEGNKGSSEVKLFLKQEDEAPSGPLSKVSFWVLLEHRNMREHSRRNVSAGEINRNMRLCKLYGALVKMQEYRE